LNEDIDIKAADNGFIIVNIYFGLFISVRSLHYSCPINTGRLSTAIQITLENLNGFMVFAPF